MSRDAIVRTSQEKNCERSAEMTDPGSRIMAHQHGFTAIDRIKTYLQQ